MCTFLFWTEHCWIEQVHSGICELGQFYQLNYPGIFRFLQQSGKAFNHKCEISHFAIADILRRPGYCVIKDVLAIWIILPLVRHNSTPHAVCENPWWRHQVETFSALLAICAGNSPVSGEFPTQRPVTRSFDVFFDLRLNKWLSKQSWGWWYETLSCPLWRQCNVRLITTSFVIVRLVQGEEAQNDQGWGLLKLRSLISRY